MILPAELYRLIVDEVDHEDRTTLVSLSSTSRPLKLEADRVLYRNFVNVQNAKTLVLFCKTVIACPHLASLVQYYKLHCYTILDVKSGHEFWQLLPLALQAFTKLKRVHIEMIRLSTPFTYVLHDVKFQLTHLHWGCRLEAEFIPFLSQQHALRSLHVMFYEATPHIPSSALRNLHTLSGDRAAITTLLPGRNIEVLEWIIPQRVPWDLPPLPLHSVPSESRRIHTFTAIVGLGWETLLKLSPDLQQMPNLRRFYLHGTAPLIDLHILSHLPLLEHFKFTKTYTIIPPTIRTLLSLSGREREQNITEVFSILPNLRTLDVDVSERTSHGRNMRWAFERWSRGASKPLLLEQCLERSGWDLDHLGDVEEI